MEQQPQVPRGRRPARFTVETIRSRPTATAARSREVGIVPIATDARAVWERRQRLAFWLLAAVLTMFLFAASAPSPLYPAYASRWHLAPITLTEVYAIYALGALAAILVSGRVSDHVGRRPVTVLALALVLGSLVLFIEAAGVAWLFAARFLGGAAAGTASGALSAWLLDLGPPGDRRLGGLVGSLALTGGLALGALCTGLLAQFGPDPLHLVYWILLAWFVVAGTVVFAAPDVVHRQPGWIASLRPKVEVPAEARPLFIAVAPSLIAMWSVGGLYLSLGPSLASAVTGVHNSVVGGLGIALLLGGGAVASFATRASADGAPLRHALVGLLLGLGLTLIAVAAHSPVGFFAGSLLAGLGFGPAFSGIFRTLTRAAPPDRRAALVAAVYVTVYLSFSIPAVAAGAAVTKFGLVGTADAFGLVAMGLVAVTAATVSRGRAYAEATGV